MQKISLDTPITELELSMRSMNALTTKSYGEEASPYVIFADLIKAKPHQLLRRKNFGRRSLNEIEHLIKENGFEMGVPHEETIKSKLRIDLYERMERMAEQLLSDFDEKIKLLLEKLK